MYREKVLEIGESHSYEDGFNGKFGVYRIAKIEEALKLLSERDSVLEVGAGEGRITEYLASQFNQVTAIEPSPKFCEKIEERHVRNVEVCNMFFEDWRSDEKFDCVVATGVLEHVQNVSEFLFKVKHALKRDSIFILTVPNCASLHRRLGLRMGLIQKLEELGPIDERVGHFRYYDPQTLVAELNENGFQVLTWRGIFVKPFPFSEMEKLSPEYIGACYELGNELPELCAEIFAVAKRMF